MPRTFTALVCEAANIDLPDGRPASHDAFAEAKLATILEDAQRAWPTIALSPDHFFPYLGARLETPSEGSAWDALGALRTSDLYLACACVMGVSGAASALEATFFGDLTLSLRSFSPEIIDDVKQILREDLLMARGACPPKLAEYRGRGDLRAWLRVVATRIALKQIRSERKGIHESEQVLLDAHAEGDDPELLLMKGRYLGAFKGAFAASFEALDDREKNILRHYFVDGLTVERMASVYGVHRVTASHWLSRAREKLGQHIKTSLRRQLRVSEREYTSIVRLVESQLDLSLKRVLGHARDGQ
ncbi:MAG: hypothetical protein NVS3B20_18800 [Polyangiales bacterium]